nr:glutathione-S-transferase [Aphelinus asychis]
MVVTGKIIKQWKWKHLKNLFRRPLGLRGGATYRGKSAEDAKIILDKSQHGRSHPRGQSGHPRGHASDPNATGPTESVEQYSMTGPKTGFQSRADQNLVVDLALRTAVARDAMTVLNVYKNKADKEKAVIRPHELQIDEEKLPKVQEWDRGKITRMPERMEDVILILQHHENAYNQENSDVFVLTAYPRMRRLLPSSRRVKYTKRLKSGKSSRKTRTPARRGDDGWTRRRATSGRKPPRRARAKRRGPVLSPARRRRKQPVLRRAAAPKARRGGRRGQVRRLQPRRRGRRAAAQQVPASARGGKSASRRPRVEHRSCRGRGQCVLCKRCCDERHVRRV